jgi:hypothetical protein
MLPYFHSRTALLEGYQVSPRLSFCQQQHDDEYWVWVVGTAASLLAYKIYQAVPYFSKLMV